MWSTQMRHTAFWAIGETALPGKEADQAWTKVMADHKALSKDR